MCGLLGSCGENGLDIEIINLMCLQNIDVDKSRRQLEV